MTQLIQLENIIYQVKDQTILSIPNLSIYQGEILGVMGPNGAGKSTLLKVLSFLEDATSGQVFYRQKPISANTISLEERRKFAVAMQQSLLFDTTVYQNVAAGLKIRKVSNKQIAEKVDYWLDKFQISHLTKKQANFLSGGEAQRVNLARAMALDPEVLFLDEPFSALDYPTKVHLLKDLKNILKNTKTTTVFISHDLTEVKYMTDRLSLLIDGQIKQIGDTRAVIASPNSATASFLNEWNMLEID
ncbi:ABC transporter ATP-binding protein [Cytobacillus spongiae]|jgi:tungstate transport system ATP-binding protein|uniref:ABC transporter ATP-binding protein n=1 Tax=Cytobacillus spongiae TaxID=2901381 RepID=UPI001F34590E|nr:ABC transporter ATP-binding protein [Cytobacillus spongiae]UII55478.1 ABC transporter ATP-binding protein [Cytobacillus spongiae]